MMIIENVIMPTCVFIEKELKKCDLVCSNCHRIRTQKRRTGSGTGGNL
jgi:hypothetical protein